MKSNMLNNRDFWTGVMFVAIGVTSMLVARNYAFGNARHMGPGFYPSILGGLLTLMGIYTIVKGIQKKEKFEGNWSVRALITIPVFIVLAAFVMKHWGFIPALVLLIIGSAYAGREFKFSEVLPLAIGLTFLSAIAFIWGLELPFPLFDF